MTYKEAKELVLGSIVIQKMHGYKFKVIAKEIIKLPMDRPYVKLTCLTTEGDTMIQKHIEVKKPEEV